MTTVSNRLYKEPMAVSTSLLIRSMFAISNSSTFFEHTSSASVSMSMPRTYLLKSSDRH